MLITRSLDMQYYGQFRDRNAPIAGGAVTRDSLDAAVAAFHRVHQQTVGYSDASYPIEIVRLHLSGTATMRKPRLNTIAAASGSDAARKGSRAGVLLRPRAHRHAGVRWQPAPRRRPHRRPGDHRGDLHHLRAAARTSPPAWTPAATS